MFTPKAESLLDLVNDYEEWEKKMTIENSSGFNYDNQHLDSLDLIAPKGQLLKPFAVRLPVTTIALIDEMYRHSGMKSKAAMINGMILEVLNSVLNAEGKEDMKKHFHELAQKALEERINEVNESNKGDIK